MSRRERREQEEKEAKERKKQEKIERKNRKKEKKLKDKEDRKDNLFLKIVKFILKFILVVILIIVLIVGCFVGWLGFKYNWNPQSMLKGGAKEVALMITGQSQEDVNNLDPIYCLVMGVSTDEGLLLTDTIIVCAYYPRTQQASMMSIPRDTFVGKSEYRATSSDKINAVYANYDGGKKGAAKLLDRVEELTDLEIDNYIVVKNEGLIKIVDEIGGIYFDVPINMDYDDWSQDLHIHLKAGKQLIDGEKAEQLLRFRHNNDGSSYPDSYGGEDLGRTQTQRDFITETIRQTLKLKNISKINSLIKIAFANTETNMKLDYVLKYSPAAVEFDANSLQNAYMPGTPVMYSNFAFYKADKKEIKKIVDEMFTFKHKVAEVEQEEGVPVEPQYLTLKIYDGTGDKDSFEEAVNRLESKGYNVKTTELTSVVKNTRIINRSNKNEETIDELINCLGAGDEEKGRTSSECDITIIIGQDVIIEE